MKLDTTLTLGHVSRKFGAKAVRASLTAANMEHYSVGSYESLWRNVKVGRADTER